MRHQCSLRFSMHSEFIPSGHFAFSTNYHFIDSFIRSIILQ